MAERSDDGVLPPTGNIDPALLKMPDSIDATGDPVDANPFPSSSGLHQIWTDATRVAQAEERQVRAAWLEIRLSTAECTGGVGATGGCEI